MKRPSSPTIKDIRRMLTEEGERKRDLGRLIIESRFGPCGAAHGQYPTICGRTGLARIVSDGITQMVIFRCEEHSHD